MVYQPLYGGDFKSLKIDFDRAKKMAVLMENGATFEEARLQTKPPAPPDPETQTENNMSR